MSTETKLQEAIVFEEKGKTPKISKIPIPTPTAKQVLIAVKAAGINPVDWKTFFYNWQNLTLPHAIGTDVSGTIAAVGSDVKDFKVGDEVFTTVNLRAPGSFAEFVVTETCRLARKGDKLTHVQAASLPVAFLSAWDGLKQVKTSPKQTIFVPGGAGGVGNFIIQLAKAHGLTIISTAGKEDSVALLKKFGVDHILNYKTDDIVEATLKITEGKGVDFSFDATYQKSSFLQSAKVLKEGAAFIILGGTNKFAADSAEMKLINEKKGSLIVADLVPYSEIGGAEDKQREGIAVGLEEAVKLFEKGSLETITKTVGWSGVVDVLLELQKGVSIPGKQVFDLSIKPKTES